MPQLRLEKYETKLLKDWNELMKIVLLEWGFTTKSVELEIRNRSMCDLDSENLNLYNEEMQSMYASVLEGTEHAG